MATAGDRTSGLILKYAGVAGERPPGKSNRVLGRP